MAPRPQDYASRGGGGGVIGRRRRCGVSGCLEFSSPSLFSVSFLSQAEAPSTILSSTLAAFLSLAGSIHHPPEPPLPACPSPPSLFLPCLLFSRRRPSAINRLPARAGRPRPRCSPAWLFRSPKGRDFQCCCFWIPSGLLLLVVSLPLELASLAQKQVRILFSPPALLFSMRLLCF